jgi:hypothetical protein
MILINISNPDSITYLLSQPSFIGLQSLKLTDIKIMNIEISEYYINFLKTLASRLDRSNIHLFFNQVKISNN